MTVGITKRKCKVCCGTGQILYKNITLNTCYKKECPECEGLGVPLRTTIEEQFEDCMIEDGTYLYPDQERFVDFEEEDYEY